MGLNKFSESYRQRMREQLAFRKWMRCWRRQLMISQTELAESVSDSGYWTVSYYETGKQAIPDHLIDPISEFLVSRGASGPPPIAVSDPSYSPPPGVWHSPEYTTRHQDQAEFRDRMAKTRIKVGLSQTELGRRTGLSQEAISFYENGLQAIPEAMLDRISNALRDAANSEE